MEDRRNRLLLSLSCSLALAVTAGSGPSTCSPTLEGASVDFQARDRDVAPARLPYSLAPRERHTEETPEEVASRTFGEALRAATDGTWLRVRTGGHCGAGGRPDVTIATLRDPEEVAAFVRRLEVDDAGSECACCGARTLEFRRGDDVVVSLSLHHGSRLRWTPGPAAGPGDLPPRDIVGAPLTDSASRYLTDWLGQYPGGASGWMFVEDPGPQPAPGAESPRELAFGTTSLPTFVISPDGFEVRPATLTPPGACAPDPSAPPGHDFEWLRRCTAALAWDSPEVGGAVVLVAREVPFDVMVRTLDIVRGSPEAPAFPRITVGIDAWSRL